MTIQSGVLDHSTVLLYLLERSRVVEGDLQ